VAYEFLSNEWIEAVKGVRDKYADQAPPVSYKMKMNQVITGAPFGDGTLELFMDTTSGEVHMEYGQLTDADLTISTDYTTAKTIFVEQDPQAGMAAFMSGKIKVTGDMMKLMQMQAVQPDEFTKQVAQEIKDLTL
jgi:putative sterol carrier protein